MGDIRNCRRCGKLFNYIKIPICPACEKKEEEDFEIARDYVKEHPGCSMKVVEKETGVSIKLLSKFLREHKLEFSDGSSPIMVCESCGTPLSSGRFCNNCLNKLGQEMLQQTKSSKPAAPAPVTDDPTKGMHYSKRNK